ncbi:MAG: hypothetical protein M3Q95_06125 [Bacteroidota bacterium]|nr:hypothetical protein [Bacteroidota bacterium]
MNKTVVILLLLLAIAPVKVKAQWTQSEQPTGGYSAAIARVGNEIWDGTLYGIYYSANEGITWHRHPTLLQPTIDLKTKGDSVIMLIQERPSAFVYNLSTMTSFDGGLTWGNPVVVETGNTYYTWGARDIYIMDSSLVINSNSEEYYISLDFGQSWDTLSLPGYSNISAHSSKYMLAYNGYPGQLGNYYSDNGGQTWNFIDSAYVASNAVIMDSTFLFVSYFTDTITHYFIARTSDFGLTYDTLFVNNDYVNSIKTFNGKVLYLVYNYPLPPYMYESADTGTTWTLSAIPEELIWINDSRALLLSNWDYLFSGGTLGLYRYNPASQSAYLTETGIRAHTMTSMEENNGVLYSKSDGRIFRSDNAGATWTEPPSFVNGNAGFDFVGDTILAFTKVANSTSNFCYSLNNGITWDSVFTSFHPYWINPAFIKYYAGKIYVSNNNFVAVSDDWGATWDSVSTAMDTICFSSTFYPARLVICNNELFLLNTGGNNVVKLDTITNTWKKKVCYSAPGVQYKGLFSLEGKLLVAAGSEFKYSADSGNTWISPARIGFPSTTRPRALFAKDGVWYASGAGNIYYSFNNGDNWQQLPTIPEMGVSGPEDPIFAFLNEILYAGGNNIWWRSDTLDIISGHVYYDQNNNSVKDPQEYYLPNRLLYTTPNNIAYTTDTTGFYQFFIGSIGDTLRPALPTSFCTSNPAYELALGAATNVDFGLYLPQGIQDLTIDMTNRTPFRPWFETIIDVEVKNLGSVDLPALVQVVLDSTLTYQNSNINPVTISGDTLTFLTDTISFLGNRKISIQVQTSVMDTIGTPIFCSALVEPLSGDTVPSNNFSVIQTLVVGSFDPNDKSANHDPYFTPQQLQNNEEMQYIIRFQNTGNFQADFVRIVDTLSSFTDQSTFRLISSSHDVRFGFDPGRVVTFYFDNINLPDSTADEPNSHGYVKFGIHFFQNLPIGTGIENTAAIYFDFNSPVITNTVSTLIADPPINVSVEEFEHPQKLLVFPNPVSEMLTILLEGNQPDQAFILVIYDLSGRIITQSEFTGHRFTTDVSSYSNGPYAGSILVPGSDKRLQFRFVVLH